MQELNLTATQVRTALPRIAVGLTKYTWLQNEVLVRDVSRDIEYRKRFGGFYRVRRNAKWRDAFFGILERAKSAPVSFGDTLRALHAETGRVEASFASKLVATLDAAQPVIDSVVFRNLGLKLPTGTAAQRFSEIQDLHQGLSEIYSRYLASDDGRNLVQQFRASYPSADVSETKMLDLILWQSR